MLPQRRAWITHARQTARGLLQYLYEEYAMANDHRAAAVVERIVESFDKEFLIRRNNPAGQLDEKISALHEQGMSIREIAERLDIDYQKVHYRLTRVLGITPHHKYIRRAAPAHIKAAAEDQALLDMYKSGLSTGDIAAGSDMSRQRVHQRIKRALGTDSLMDVRYERDRREVFSIAEDTDVIMKKRNMKKVDVDD